MSKLKKIGIIAFLAATLSAEVFVLIPGTTYTNWDLLFGVLYGSVKGDAGGTCNSWPYQHSVYHGTIITASCSSNVSMEASGHILDPSTVASEGWARLDYFPAGIGPLIREAYGYRNCNGGSAESGYGSGGCWPE